MRPDQCPWFVKGIRNSEIVMFNTYLGFQLTMYLSNLLLFHCSTHQLTPVSVHDTRMPTIISLMCDLTASAEIMCKWHWLMGDSSTIATLTMRWPMSLTTCSIFWGLQNPLDFNCKYGSMHAELCQILINNLPS